MPILEVEVVLKDGDVLDPRAAARIADAAASVFGAPPGNTWVRVRTLLFSAYAEDAGGPPDGLFPVFVSVLKARCGGPGEMACEAERLTRAIAPILERPPENVHILYEPDGAGRVSFGGSLVGTGRRAGRSLRHVRWEANAAGAGCRELGSLSLRRASE